MPRGEHGRRSCDHLGRSRRRDVGVSNDKSALLAGGEVRCTAIKQKFEEADLVILLVIEALILGASVLLPEERVSAGTWSVMDAMMARGGSCRSVSRSALWKTEAYHSAVQMFPKPRPECAVRACIDQWQDPDVVHSRDVIERTRTVAQPCSCEEGAPQYRAAQQQLASLGCSLRRHRHRSRALPRRALARSGRRSTSPRLPHPVRAFPRRGGDQAAAAGAGGRGPGGRAALVGAAGAGAAFPRRGGDQAAAASAGGRGSEGGAAARGAAGAGAAFPRCGGDQAAAAGAGGQGPGGGAAAGGAAGAGGAFPRRGGDQAAAAGAGGRDRRAGRAKRRCRRWRSISATRRRPSRCCWRGRSRTRRAGRARRRCRRWRSISATRRRPSRCCWRGRSRTRRRGRCRRRCRRWRSIFVDAAETKPLLLQIAGGGDRRAERLRDAAARAARRRSRASDPPVEGPRCRVAGDRPQRRDRRQAGDDGSE